MNNQKSCSEATSTNYSYRERDRGGRPDETGRHFNLTPENTREFYERLSEKANDGVAIVASSGVIVYQSRSAAGMSGHEPGELIGRNAFELIHPEDAPGVISTFTDGLSEPGRVETLRFRQRRKDGEWQVIEATGRNLLEDPLVRGVVVNFRDITEKWRAQADLQRFYHVSRELMIICTAQGVIRKMNPASETMLGYAPSEMVDRNIREFIHPDDPFMDHDAAVALSAPGKDGEFENRFRAKDGSYRWLAWSTVNVPDEDLIYAVARDVTEKVAIEKDLRESEEKYRSMMEAMAQPAYICSSDFRVKYMNPAMSKRIGPDKLGQACHLAIHGREKQCPGCAHQRLKAGRPFFMEVHSPLDDRTYHVANSPIFHVDGTVSKMTIFTDITEVKQAEAALRKSEATLHGVLQAAPVGIGVMSGRSIGWTNERLAEMTGYSSDELRSVPVSQLFENTDDYERGALDGHASNAPRHEIGSMETRWRRKNGDVVDIALNSAGIETPDLSGDLVFTAMDISERKRAEAALRQSESRLRDMLTNVKLAAVMLDNDGNVSFCNQFLLDLMGWRLDELKGRNWFDTCLPETQRTYIRRMFERFITSGHLPPHEENHIITRNGELRMVAWNNTVLRNESGAVVGAASLGTDITEIRKVERQRELLAAAVDQVVECVAITDTNGILQYVNPAFEEITGYGRDEVIGKSPRLLRSGLQEGYFYQDMWMTIAQGGVWKGNLTNKAKDGALFEVETTISPIKDESGRIVNYVAVERDVTREKSLERQLQQAQKMEALGTLAGGIAHDFNNILGPIIGYTDLALMDLSEEQPIYHALQEVSKAGRRAKDLVGQILTFSRRTEPRLDTLNIVPIVKEAIRFIRASLPSTIEIRQHIAETSRMIKADPTQIHQVIINLATNAGQAMKDAPGILTVGLSEVVVRRTDEPLARELQGGSYLRLTVSDTGPGIPSEILDRIFDPFFTTKGPGEGTGLGLSVVHGIVKKHKGAMTVQSRSGQGASFDVYFPIEHDGREVDDAPDLPPIRGAGRILLIDDEAALAKMGGELLEHLGYEVEIMTDARAAWDLLASGCRPFDLIITDQTMPHLTGKDLASKLNRFQIQVPVILCTGTGQRTDLGELKTLGIQGFLKKPYILGELARLVDDVLRAHRRRRS